MAILCRSSLRRAAAAKQSGEFCTPAWIASRNPSRTGKMALFARLASATIERRDEN
jgi:hypothetical protein